MHPDLSIRLRPMRLRSLQRIRRPRRHCYPDAAVGRAVVMALGLAMIVLDSSIVNVSIPTIIADIGINLTDAQWVTSLYNIVLAALLLPFGKLGDAGGANWCFKSVQ